MRILQIITQNELGGAQVVVAHLVNSFVKEHEVIVASGEGDGAMYGMFDERVKIVNCPFLKRRVSPLNDLLALFDFWRLCIKYKPDVVHLHSSKAGALGRIAFPTRKIVYTVHGFDSVRTAFRPFLRVERLLQKACKKIVAVSEYDKVNLKGEGITNNVLTIYNGAPFMKPSQDLTFDIPPKFKKVVLCIARVSPQKELNLFMQTAKLLPQYAFVWIGNREAIEHSQENLFFMGNITNAAMYNSIADVFVLPSNYEGLPVVIIEALSHGKPVVASNVGGVSELVADGVNGYLVNNVAEEFAEKIDTLLKDENLAARFSKNARNMYEEKFTLEQMVKKYGEVYDEIVAKR